jgi:hypothetical protein
MPKYKVYLKRKNETFTVNVEAKNEEVAKQLILIRLSHEVANLDEITFEKIEKKPSKN